MAIYLVVHTRYADVQCALFRGESLIESVADESKRISKNFFFLVENLLKNNKLSLANLSFIAAHQGPAPFTSLRTCLAAVNGCSFATGIPLIGSNGLELLLREYKRKTQVTVVLLHAFAHELYYAVYDPETDETLFGYAQADQLLRRIAHTYENEMLFVGNGVPLYADLITELFGTRMSIATDQIVSISSVALDAKSKWDAGERHTQLMPIYLKDYSGVILQK